MIELDVNEFCENCNNFKPHVKKMDTYDGNGEYMCTSIITCKHEHRCMGMMRYLSQQTKKQSK